MAFTKRNNEIMFIESTAANADITAELAAIQLALKPPPGSIVDFVNTDADKLYIRTGQDTWVQLLDYA